VICRRQSSAAGLKRAYELLTQKAEGTLSRGVSELASLIRDAYKATLLEACLYADRAALAPVGPILVEAANSLTVFAPEDHPIGPLAPRERLHVELSQKVQAAPVVCIDPFATCFVKNAVAFVNGVETASGPGFSLEQRNVYSSPF
jgi:hypothetical protein